MSQSVLILGSQGVLGSLVTDAFGQAGWTTTGASRRARSAPGVRHVDLGGPETLEDVLDDVKPDLVVSSVPDGRFTAERAVLRRGGLILNFSTVDADGIRQLRQSPAPGEGTAVMYAGIAPGLSNLVTADLLAGHPEADEIEMAFTVSADSSSGPASSDSAYDSLKGVARVRTAAVPLPAPFGRTRGLAFPNLPGWAGSLGAGKTVSAYVCLTPRPVRYALLAANATGLLSRLPRVSANPPRTPADASSEPVAHWIAVRKNGTRLAARTIRCHGDYRSSAAVTVLLARAITGAVPPPGGGVLFPEEILTLDDIRPGLAGAGITIVDEKTV
jgi:NAD-dependent epimerase/dehydratase family protein